MLIIRSFVVMSSSKNFVMLNLFVQDSEQAMFFITPKSHPYYSVYRGIQSPARRAPYIGDSRRLGPCTTTTNYCNDQTIFIALLLWLH